MPYKPKPPTSTEVLARQKAAAAPKPVSPPTSNSSAIAKPGTLPAQTDAFGLPAVPDTRSSVERYLDEVAPSMIVGRLAKFSKEGKSVVQDTQEEIDPEADFLALLDQTFVGWIKFNEDAPPDRVMGLLYGGFVMPPRDTLGNLDQSKWKIGLSGKPEDDWKHQIYLVLQHADTKELYTYVVSSRTGRSAAGNLLRHYDRMRRTHPDELPVVRIKTGGFQHKDERVGWVNTPVFVVVGRAPADSAVRPDTSVSADMEDEIPTFE
jgi:hypothetical protein